MLAFIGSEHGECPHDCKRVLQLVIEESSVSTSLSNDVDCSLHLHEGDATRPDAEINIPLKCAKLFRCRGLDDIRFFDNFCVCGLGCACSLFRLAVPG